MKRNNTVESWIIFIVVILFFILLSNFSPGRVGGGNTELSQDLIVPTEGVILPIDWNSLGKKMTEAGIIDGPLLESIYSRKGGLTAEEKAILYGNLEGNIVINRENSGFLLNMLWAYGLSNRNPILEEGEMTNPKYGGAGRFASTGGWTISKGDSMNYYSKYDFIVLTSEQQKLVERVSKNIYRPCCNNPTSFPDCNHGMAMLGLLELLAKNGLSEEEMYDIALRVNSYWFPNTYLNIAKYFDERGVNWSEVNSKEVLGVGYSSASGYRRVLESVKPAQLKSDGGC